MTVQIREVKNHRQLRDFIRFPLSLYKNNRYYVPSLYMDEMNTLRSDKNPAFADAKARYFSVSYTHLTLPTKRIV